MLSSKLRLRPPGFAGVVPLPLAVAAFVVFGGVAAAAFMGFAVALATAGAVSALTGFGTGFVWGFSIFMTGVGAGGGSVGAVSPDAGGADSSWIASGALDTSAISPTSETEMDCGLGAVCADAIRPSANRPSNRAWPPTAAPNPKISARSIAICLAVV